MNDAVIASVDHITKEWLTAVLTRKGSLITGGIRDFQVEAEASVNAKIARIGLRYHDGSTGELPDKLLLKMCHGEDAGFGPSEVHYYSRDYAGLTNAPIPVCYDAAYSEEQRRYHILMADLSATHRNNWGTPPTLAYGCAVAEAAARLHAYRWQPDQRVDIQAAIPGAAEIERYIGQIKPGLMPMLAATTHDIEPAWATALIDIFEKHPPLMHARSQNMAGFCLVHGDLNPGNILSPIEGSGTPYLIDRQPFDWSLTTWLGVSDIAYMMVHWWDTAIRRQCEWPILRHYHESLLRCGVRDYSGEQLVYDYTLCAVQSIYVAVEWCVNEQDRQNMRWVWFPQLQRAMAAFYDLRCAALWA